jgi:uncharacterized protein YbaR (Trm112 family)
MKKELAEFLICPACLPRETPVALEIYECRGNDILSGRLVCPSCGRLYPVDEGIAELIPASASPMNRAQHGYEDDAALSSYLWTHYADIFGDSHSSDAYRKWASLVEGSFPLALEVGCAVGRFGFEISGRCDFTVGIDLSRPFIRVARRLALERTLEFELIIEGILREKCTVSLPPYVKSDKVEFLVADALALPFPHGVFPVVASLNVLDKIPRPLSHLQEVNRVAWDRQARFLFSDPFSWSPDNAAEAQWLGGKIRGEYAGFGRDNVRNLLEGKDDIIQPPWHIDRVGEIWWKIRNHRNHYELIRSEYILAIR